MKILVADDDPAIRENLTAWLARLGHEVDTAGDGKECLRKMALEVYDLLMLDLVLPEIDGENVLQVVASRFAGTDVIVMSAQDDESVIREVLGMGTVAYIVKPGTQDEFVGTVTDIETQRKQRSTLSGSPANKIM